MIRIPEFPDKHSTPDGEHPSMAWGIVTLILSFTALPAVIIIFG
jgi:hypothetical protein